MARTKKKEIEKKLSNKYIINLIKSAFYYIEIQITSEHNMYIHNVNLHSNIL